MADAPTLKDANGNVIDPTAQDYTPPTIEITGIEDDGIRIYNIPVMHYESENSGNTPSVNFLGNEILNVEVFGNPSVGVASDISSLEEAIQQSAITISNDEEHHYLYGEMNKIKFSFQGNEIDFSSYGLVILQLTRIDISTLTVESTLMLVRFYITKAMVEIRVFHTFLGLTFKTFWT